MAVLIVGLLAWLMVENKPSRAEQDVIAETFRFTRTPLPEVAGHPPYQKVRKVHPSLKHIDVYMSSLGAAVTVGDHDGDGRANDVVHVDTRTDQVIWALPRIW